MEPLNLAEFERLAAERLDVAALGYFAGGAGDERTLAANVEAYRAWQLRPRVLVDVAAPATATTVLGQEVSLPVLVAPVAFQRIVHPDGEVASARAAAAAGTVFCLSSMSTSTWEEVAATGAQRWFQLYVPRDEALAAELVGGARSAGFSALVLTVDTPVLGRRERDLRSGFEVPGHLRVGALGTGGFTPRSALAHISASVTWKDVDRFAEASELPVVLKGIVTAEDAGIACDHNVAGIVVSNHGGRQLDGVSATIDALAEVVEAVDGRIEVYLDGGIRRGTDVVTALALGARAVLVGRPVIWGLALGGAEGVGQVLGLLRDELTLALQLLGAADVRQLSAAHVSRRG